MTSNPYAAVPAQAPAAGRVHELKTDPGVFQAAWDGLKTFEIRLNDRDFKVGDSLYLLETEHTGEEMRAGAPLVYTGRTLMKVVSHVLTGYGLAPGWCCLSFESAMRGAVEAEPHKDAVFAIVYDDADRRHEIIVGEGAARARFKRISTSWNAHLFGKIESNSRDDRHAHNNVSLATARAAVADPQTGKGTLNSRPFDEFEGPARALHDALCRANMIQSKSGWSFNGWTADGRAVRHRIKIEGYERTGPTVEKERQQAGLNRSEASTS